MVGKVKVERRQRLVNICKEIIDNPDSIDADTTARLKRATMRYVHTQYDEPERVLKNLYHDEGELGSLLRKAVEIVTEADSGEAEISKASGAHHLVSRLIEHLTDRLDRHRRKFGYEKSAKEEPMTSSHADFVREVAKTYGVVPLAKYMVERENSFGLSEHELVGLITDEASAAFPDLTKAQAFAKFYTEQGERSRTLQKAVSVAKETMFVEFAPGYMGVRQIGGEDVNPDRVNEALAKLAEDGAKRWPHERADVQFSNAFQDPRNAELARQAHRRPLPSTIYPYPGTTTVPFPG